MVSGLPPEILVKILATAAKGSKRDCLVLCLLSSWTHHFILPHLLSTVTLTSDEKASIFKEFITKPPTKPYTTGFNPSLLVRSLWLAKHLRHTVISSILLACTRINNLAVTDTALDVFFRTIKHNRVEAGILCGPLPSPRIQLTILNSDIVWSWNSAMTAYNSVSSQTALITSLTHIHFADAHTNAINAFLGDQFPSLSHVAIVLSTKYDSANMNNILSYFDPILNRCNEKVQMVVLITHDRDVLRSRRVSQWLQVRRTLDRRVHMVFENPKELQKDWIEEAHGGETFWERAAKETLEIESTVGDLP